MSFSVTLPPEAEAWLESRASARGQDKSSYVAALVVRMAASSSSKSLEELSGPIYQNFLESGMTDEELGDLLEDAKHAMRAERRRKATANG